MLRLAVENVQEGLHPSEVVVTIRTVDGATQEVNVDRGLVDDYQMKAYAVRADGDKVLVELPRETSSGMWRVWVPQASVSLTEKVAA